MSSSIFSNFLGNAVLQRYFAGAPTWLALHTDNPTATGDPATEMAVIRQPITWSAPGSKTIANTNAMTFVQLVADVVTYLGVWDSSSGGHLLVPILLGTPITTLEDGHFLVAPGDVAITL